MISKVPLNKLIDNVMYQYDAKIGITTNDTQKLDNNNYHTCYFEKNDVSTELVIPIKIESRC